MNQPVALTFYVLDDSAAHIAEETANAARAAPLAIIVSVIGTATLGWLFLIAASFAIPSVSDLLTTDLPLPMGQVFLNVLGKRGMLAIWSLIIVTQVRVQGNVILLLKVMNHAVYSMSRELLRQLTLLA